MMTFLWGYWGGLNVGDELILGAVLNIIGRDNIIVIARNNVQYVERVHNVTAISYYKALPYVARNKHIIGGGGLFQDTTSFHNIFYYLFPIWVGKQAILLGVGIGPLHYKLSYKLISNAFKSLSLAVTRDSVSYNFMTRKVGLTSVLLAPDITFTLTLQGVEKYHLTSEKGKNKIILIPGPSLGLYWNDVLRLTRDSNVEVVEFLPSSDKYWRNEYPSSWKVMNGIELLRQGELFDILKEGEKWIVGRLHGMILAILMHKPFYPMIYDSKMIILLKDLGVSNYNVKEYVSINNIEVSKWRDKAHRIYKGVAQYLVREGWVG